MGILVTGSIINPRIFISTSMWLRSKPLRAQVRAISIYAPESIGSACTGLADYASYNVAPLQTAPGQRPPVTNYALNSIGSARGGLFAPNSFNQPYRSTNC